MSVVVKAVDPRTGQAGAEYPAATRTDVHEAAVAAAAAFRDPRLRDRAARSAALRGTARRLRDAGDEVRATAEGETALAEGRLRMELERTCLQLEAFATLLDDGGDLDVVIDLADPDAPLLPRPDVRRTTVPLGPVAVFGASNFPLAFGVAGGDTASALAAGCPVVVKGHPSHPGTGELVAGHVHAAVAEAGLPEGAFAHLAAPGIEVGEWLVDEPAIAAVAFTGSQRGGLALVRRAAERPVPIPVYAEMGSINPVVLTPGAVAARGDAIAEALTASVATSGGQLCTKPGLVFAPATREGERFTARLAEALAATEASHLLNAGIRRALDEGVGVLDGLPGAERLTPHRDLDEDGGFAHPAVLYRTTVADLAREPELATERFGPVAVVAHYASEDELLGALDGLEGQLTGTVHAEGDEDVLLSAIVERLTARVGRVVFDGVPTGVPVTHAMVHGGPYPATSSPLHTSVGTTAIRRFQRPVSFQNAPAAVLPPELRDDNPLGAWRQVNGHPTRDAL